MYSHHNIFLEIGLDSNPWLFIPPKETLDTLDKPMFARGHCYDSCFKDDLPEITIHSILGFGSRHVTKMKILKLTKGEMGKPCPNCKRNCFKWNRSSTSFEKWIYTIQWFKSNKAWNLKHSSDALIYNENHVNNRYQAFKVIRPTKIKVILLWKDCKIWCLLVDYIFS